MPEERRSSRRARIAGVRVVCESAAGDRVEADAVDLSTGGLFIRTKTPLAVGKRLAVEIQVLGEKEPWSALGRVVWVRLETIGDNPPGMGVKLIDVDDDMMAALERLVDTREATVPGTGVVAPVEREPTVPGPGVVAPRQREPTLMGIGDQAAPQLPVPPPPPRAPPAPTAPEPTAEKRPGAVGRAIVMLLLIVVAAIAGYVLLDGFLAPPPR